jgi:hypothetical protein
MEMICEGTQMLDAAGDNLIQVINNYLVAQRVGERP